ncbi:MAG: AtpZ/AtpI family protein [Ignavibacteriales bacterium]|nr:MAG: AtpZ/AtpI family protein [Ignavibacteriales bacterium]
MSDKGKDTSDLSRTYREIAPYIGLGTQLAVTVTAMVFLGIWLDGELNTNPVLTIVGSFIGVAAGMYHFIKSVTKSGQ